MASKTVLRASVCIIMTAGMLLGGAGRVLAAARASAPLSAVFGADIDPRVQIRLTHLLQRAEPTLQAGSDAGGTVLAFGSTALAAAVIPDRELQALGSEAFIVRAGTVGGRQIFAARGNPLADAAMVHGNIGAHFAAYALLQELGFAFLRPLAPTVPAQLHLATAGLEEAPRWRIRAIHIHTQHPLELTNVLQGWGHDSPADLAGFNAMLPEWESYVEWLLANRQNRVEWALLWADEWKDFADSDERLERLGLLVDMAHAYGVGVGVDVPIVFQQQHAFRLVRATGDLSSELGQLRHSVDWLMDAGFDFLGTETGSTEFTHPSAENTLAWMNELANYTASAYGKPVYIKVHCSTGQVADDYPDPVTGQPINFNMLPHFADPHMGVLPHTVEHYGLDDPAPTYGNTDFAYIRDFLRREVGRREVVYFPETSYWVGYDIDVPLFLPIYADRRVHDLRLLAGDEDAGRMGTGADAGKHMDGQLIFSSGWEWGYWLNDVVAARAAWQPHNAASSDREALLATLKQALPVFGPAAPAVAGWVADFAAAEHDLLTYGKVGGVLPKAVNQRNGQAYLEGFDAWTDITHLAALLPGSTAIITQPMRLGLVDGRGPLADASGVAYGSEVAPLLAEMESTFARLVSEGAALQARIPPDAQLLYEDLLAAAKMTALRAQQQHGLYDYALSSLSGEAKSARLAVARQALDAAAVVVKQREAAYAVPDLSRIAGWHKGPASYPFGYLWTVHSLYYWWRDEGKAVDAPLSPCYMNVLNEADIGVGDPNLLSLMEWLNGILDPNSFNSCLEPPKDEPVYPRDGLRSRPS